jgi:hypothetical protein
MGLSSSASSYSAPSSSAVALDVLTDTNVFTPEVDSSIQEKALATLSAKVSDVNTKLTLTSNKMDGSLIEQKKVNNIITTEKTRLDTRKTAIDDAITSQNRIIYFNNNTRKVYEAYIKIVIVLAITLAIIWVIRLVGTNQEFIPDWILDILFIATISISIIIIYNYYIDIRIRSRYNFDELNLDAPPVTSTDSINKGNGSNLFDGISTCIGADCCTGSMVWDEDIGKCATPSLGFTTISESGIEGLTMPPNLTEPKSTTAPNSIANLSPIKIHKPVENKDHFISQIKPDDAFEYSDYSPYK